MYKTSRSLTPPIASLVKSDPSYITTDDFKRNIGHGRLLYAARDYLPKISEIVDGPDKMKVGFNNITNYDHIDIALGYFLHYLEHEDKTVFDDLVEISIKTSTNLLTSLTKHPTTYGLPVDNASMKKSRKTPTFRKIRNFRTDDGHGSATVTITCYTEAELQGFEYLSKLDIDLRVPFILEMLASMESSGAQTTNNTKMEKQVSRPIRLKNRPSDLSVGKIRSVLAHISEQPNNNN